MISFIVAMDRNHVIGSNNQMPWHLPNDLRFFKETTTGNTIVMGRKTFESIGRVLPNRKHIVITKSTTDFPNEVEVVHDIETIVKLSEDNNEEELFVIGGGDIFKQLLPYADKLYVTLINETFEGDVFFPVISMEEWEEVSREKGIQNERNPYEYYFIQYVRKT